MTHREFRMLLVLLLGIAGSTLAQAQTPVALIHDLGVGAINFAAGDLKAALVQNGYSVTDLPLGDLSRATQAVRIILTTSDANVPGMPTISGLTNQDYAIQQVVDGSATNWWVIGQDAPGAMYWRRHAPNHNQPAGELERCPGCDQSLPGRHHQSHTIFSREAVKTARQTPRQTDLTSKRNDQK